MCQLDWITGWNIILSGVWRYFSMKLSFELADWIKQIACSNVGGPHLISQRLYRTKRVKNRELLFPDFINWFVSHFLPSDLNRKIFSSWVFSFLVFKMVLHHRLSCVSSLLTADLGISQPSNCISQFLLLILFLCLLPIGFVSENPN